MVGLPSATHIIWMYQHYIQTLVRKSTSTTQPPGFGPDNRGHKVNPSVAARSPSVRWGHRKLCPVAKLDNVACGNRTRLTISASPYCHALPQLYHHHGSEEKRGVLGFSPLAQYNHKGFRF